MGIIVFTTLVDLFPLLADWLFTSAWLDISPAISHVTHEGKPPHLQGYRHPHLLDLGV